ncbi:MAG TPA: protoporphyrinogen oxidase [Myxococcota bacterium]|nr:protoporphyrinogen oxidase [Myxococcota bacterium]
MARVIVVGSGISGLAVAAWLSEDHEVIVLEASDTPGGNVRSEVIEGFVFDKAANGWLDDEPAVARLLEKLDVEEVKATEGDRYVVLDGELVALPTSPKAFLTSPVLPWWARLRAMLEPLMRRGPDEESVASFARRRLGDRALRNLIGPMVSGVYAGNPERLSLAACFPKLKVMEREHGSLILAARHRGGGFGPKGRLTTLRGGAGELTLALAAGLDVRTGATVERIEPGWRVLGPELEMRCDAVVLATPAYTSATITRALDNELAAGLEATPYAGVAVVCAGLPRVDGLPDGFGALVPVEEGLGILGTLFTSSIFPGHGPEDGFALRTILGGARNPLQATLDPQELAAIARRDNEALLGPLPPPLVTRVYQHPRGIPQYVLGHRDRVRGVRATAAAHPGLFLVGNHLEGIGVKNCIAAGETCAARVGQWLS